MYGKMEIEDILHLTDKDQIYVIDPEGEFVNQCKASGCGEVIKISSNTTNYINPFQVSSDHNQSEDTLIDKADLILSLFEIFKNAPLTAKERTIIDRCVKLVYKDYINSKWADEKVPTFATFDAILKQQPEIEITTDLCLYLEMYITGTVNIFSHKSNVDMDKRYIVFDIRELGANLRAAGMLIIIDFLQNAVFENWKNGVWSWLYVDEFQTFYSGSEENNSCAKFFEKMFARFRKYGGLATGLTQNITNVLKSDTAVSMLQNSQFVVLLEQASENLEQVTRMYRLSEQQASRLVSSKIGEGLLMHKNIAYQFEKLYPKNNIIYNTITTSFSDKIAQLTELKKAE